LQRQARLDWTASEQQGSCSGVIWANVGRGEKPMESLSEQFIGDVGWIDTALMNEALEEGKDHRRH
jgi:hypothetical protein